MATAPVLSVEGVKKTFTMHLRGGVTLAVVANASFTVAAGECVVLGGPSGAGKSSIMKIVAGRYGASAGAVRVAHRGALVDTQGLCARALAAVRRESVAEVTQFLRVIPRVAAIDIVQRAAGRDNPQADAAALLRRLNLPERLWHLPPATFSGGEKQRVNIAAGFIRHTPLILLDEPTASLDESNRDVVIQMVKEKKRADTAILGIFHDEMVRAAVADRIIDVTAFAPDVCAA